MFVQFLSYRLLNHVLDGLLVHSKFRLHSFSILCGFCSFFDVLRLQFRSPFCSALEVEVIRKIVIGLTDLTLNP